MDPENVINYWWKPALAYAIIAVVIWFLGYLFGWWS